MSTALVPVATRAVTASAAALALKQARQESKDKDKDRIVSLVQSMSSDTAKIIMAMLENKMLTAVGAFVLIESLQNVVVGRKSGVRQGIAWSTAGRQLMPDFAGSALEVAIVLNMLEGLAGEVGGAIPGIMGMFGK